MLSQKDLKKLTTKKYRREMGLCIVEGEKLVNELGGQVFRRADVKEWKEISGLENCDILSVVEVPKPAEITYPYLVLDNIQDPGNVGALLRTAGAFGFNTVFCINCADVWSQKVIRSAVGVQFKLNIIQTDKFIQPEGKLYIADLNGGSVKASGKFGLVLGNEGQGISADIKSLPHEVVTIPTKIESLNVAVAGGILMWEMTK